MKAGRLVLLLTQLSESPLSPPGGVQSLHPALPLNAYLGWTYGNFCAFLVGISVTVIASPS